MSPRPELHLCRERVLGDFARRSAALLTAVIVIGGAPLVARALDDEIVPVVASDIGSSSGAHPQRRSAERAVRPDPWIFDLGATVDADGADAQPAVIVSPRAVTQAPETEAMVDPVVASTVDSHIDEHGPRVVGPQESMGVGTDGWNVHTTQHAHRPAQEFVGLPTDRLPVPWFPPGPDASKWAALRQCESSGNYAITNASGKYRGAYQFDQPTWDSIAERHAPHLVGVDPAAASPADQDAVAFALYSERGARPWPQCGRELS